MKYSIYVWQAIGFALVALFGIFTTIYSWKIQNWVLFVVSLLIVYVAIDNFFCGTRLRNAGVKIKGHYVIPPFLKKK